MLLALGVRGFIPFMAVFSLLIAAVVFAQMFLFSHIIAGVFISSTPPGMVTICLVVALIALRGLLIWFRERLAQRASVRIRSALRRGLLEQLMLAGPAFTRKASTGALTATVMEGVDRLDDYFTRYIPSLVHIALLPALIITFAFFTDWPSGMIMLVTGPLIVFFMWLIGTHATRLTQRQWRGLSRLSAHFLDALQGLKTLKHFGMSRQEAKGVEASGEGFRAITMQVLKVAFLSGFVLELAASISIALVAVQVGIRLIEGLMPFQPALFMLLLAPEFYLPFRTLGQHHHAGMDGATAAEKVFDVIDRRIVKAEVKVKVEKSVALNVSEESPSETRHSPASGIGERYYIVSKIEELKVEGSKVEGQKSNSQTGESQRSKVEGQKSNSQTGESRRSKIEFLDVAYSYPGAEQPALRDVSFRMEAGTMTALVGHTGSGKTTLAYLLLGYLRPSSGHIFAGGMALDAMDIAVWRGRVAYVPQHPHFFNGSVLDNLLMARPDATEAEIIAAAMQAEAHAFISRLPQGYHTLLTENASRLSGGELQRLAIARAFLKDAPLLILDEPSSMLDSKTEQLVAAATWRLAAGRTTLIIAHRLHTVRQASTIIVLDRGCIAESGSHEALVARQGLYASNLDLFGINGGGPL